MASCMGDKEYLEWLCKNFGPIFWPTKRRFAVITLERLDSAPVITTDDLRPSNPTDWNAEYFARHIPNQTVKALFEGLPAMIVRYLKEKKKLPENICLFSRHIPTQECSAFVKEFISEGFKETIRNSDYRSELDEVESVVFIIGWTKEGREKTPDPIAQTLRLTPGIRIHRKIAEDVKRQGPLDEHGKYLVQLCKHFSKIFWQTGKKEKQFAVLTFGKLSCLPKITVDHRQLYYQSEHWIAAYYGDTGTRHAEEVLFDPLPCMIEEYLNENGKLPECIYLYSRHIPSREFITIISKFIVEAKSICRAALGEVSSLVFRIGWTKEEFEKENDILRTIKDFEEISEKDGNVKIELYLKIAKDVKRSQTQRSARSGKRLCRQVGTEPKDIKRRQKIQKRRSANGHTADGHKGVGERSRKDGGQRVIEPKDIRRRQKAQKRRSANVHTADGHKDVGKRSRKDSGQRAIEQKDIRRRQKGRWAKGHRADGHKTSAKGPEKTVGK